jgi:hypothetical protein
MARYPRVDRFSDDLRSCDPLFSGDTRHALPGLFVESQGDWRFHAGMIAYYDRYYKPPSNWSAAGVPIRDLLICVREREDA